jgi:Peptidoglycan-binding protein, CsiV
MSNRTLQPALFLLLAGLSLLFGMSAAADEPRQYDVEIIVFTRHGGDDAERMVQNGAAGPQAGTAPAADTFTDLSPSAYTLDRVSNSLSSASGYSVLFHRAWRQLAYDRNHAVEYPVHTSAANGRDSVNGTVTLIRERYLHLDIELALSRAGTSSATAYPDGQAGRPQYRLSEQRRIRSSEIHYFDHPQFGVIARVTPYNAPGTPESADAPAGTQDIPPAEDAVPASEDEPSPAGDAPLSH